MARYDNKQISNKFRISEMIVGGILSIITIIFKFKNFQTTINNQNSYFIEISINEIDGNDSLMR